MFSFSKCKLYYHQLLLPLEALVKKKNEENIIFEDISSMACFIHVVFMWILSKLFVSEPIILKRFWREFC